MSNTHSYKGFFFVLVSFILLSYILVSTFAWVRAIETSERTYSDAFRASSLTTLADQVSEQRMNIYTDVASHYTLYKLVNHSVEYELLDEPDDEYYHVRAAFFELLSNCNTSQEHYVEPVPASYTPEERETYCFAGFLEQLNTSLSKAGFEVQEFSISNYSLNETAHPLELEMNLTLYLRIKDLQTQTSLNRTYHISRTLNATGFLDPLLARQSIEQLRQGGDPNLTVYKGMYLYPSWDVDGGEDLALEEAHELLYPDQMRETDTGQGWFYGDLVFWDEAENAAYPSQSILVGNYSDIKSVDNWEDFGAYILLNEPIDPPGCSDQQDTFNPIQRDEGTSGGSTRCEESMDSSDSGYTDKPFIVYADEEDFKDDIYGPSTGPYKPVPFPNSILFITQYSNEQVLADIDRKDNNPGIIFDIENLRDFVRCSYYIVNADKAPSFLQRLLVNGYERTSPIGIETTLVGKWAGGIDNPGWNDYSRVDREFFARVEGDKIRGMPGCKDWHMCAEADPLISDVGNFRFSGESAEFYLGTNEDEDEEYIGCDDGRASCENP